MSSSDFQHQSTPLNPNPHRGAINFFRRRKQARNMWIALSVILNDFQDRRRTSSLLPHNLFLGLYRWPTKHKISLRTTQRITSRIFGFRIVLNTLDRNDTLANDRYNTLTPIGAYGIMAPQLPGYQMPVPTQPSTNEFGSSWSGGEEAVSFFPLKAALSPDDILRMPS